MWNPNRLSAALYGTFAIMFATELWVVATIFKTTSYDVFTYGVGVAIAAGFFASRALTMWTRKPTRRSFVVHHRPAALRRAA